MKATGVGTLLLLALATVCAPAAAQTLRGTLRDRESDQPIPFARLLLLSEAGDSVSAVLSNGRGQFQLTAAEPGSFYLEASALGYRATRVGIFDLDRGGEISLEFRIFAAPIGLDELIVNAPGGVREGALIQNGFYDRLRSGMGHFLTPAIIQKSATLKSSELLYNIPRVNVVPDSESGGYRITMQAPTGDCTPPLWVDGVLVSREATELDLPPLSMIEAVEVYRGAAELPLQWGGTSSGGCGAIVVWTRR